MKMTDHQKRLWQSMIDVIQNYLDGKSEDFFSLVGKLEGALDASDIKDDMLIYQWPHFWKPLETRRSIEGTNVDRQKAVEELVEMKRFLLKTNNMG